MNKELLIKHIKGNVSTKEREKVVEWIDKSPNNKDYYISLLNFIVSQELPNNNTNSNTNKDKCYQELKNKINIKKFTITPAIKWASYAAIILLFISICANIYFFASPKEAKKELVYLVPALENRLTTHYTEPGVKGIVLLPDGSSVWLNSSSKINFPEHFDSNIRKIYFEGEGYFDIKSDSLWPMEITTAKGMLITVKGTKFHIKSYLNDDNEQATLFSGRIDVSKYKDGKEILRSRILKPRESMKFSDAENKPVIKTSADTSKTIAWKRGEIIFDQTPMEEVIKILERWHGVEFVITDKYILNNKFTGTFSTESIVQIMELIRFTAPVDYYFERNSNNSANTNKIYLKNRKII